MSGSGSSRRKSLRRKKAFGVTDLGTDSSGEDSSSEETVVPAPVETGETGEIDEIDKIDWDKIMRDLGVAADSFTVDDESAAVKTDEPVDPEMQKILDDLNALSQGEVWGASQETPLETTVPEWQQDTEEVGELTALNKREVWADFDFEFDFGALLGVPASKVKLVAHPKFKASSEASAPIYERMPNGDLGGVQEDPLKYADFHLYTIDRPVSVRDAKGVPMVALSYLYGGEFLVSRDAFVEETYQKTLNAIDAIDALSDQLLVDFWTKMFEPLQELTEVTLSVQLMGIPKSAVDQRQVRKTPPVAVPRGTYRKVGLVNQRLDPTQRSPFSLVIEMGGQEMVIVPDYIIGDLIEGNQTGSSEEEVGAPEKVSTSEKADVPEENPFQTIDVPPQVAEGLQQVVPEPEKARAPRLNAKQIVDLFTGSTELANYVTLPERPDWLRDEHIHYVTQDQLGAVFVLGRMPNDQQEIDAARKDDRFAQSETTNGLQVGEKIYVREDRTGGGTEYHETVHKLSHPAVLDVLGFWFNEGLTEHFTRILLEGGELVRDKNQYGQQQEAITALMDYAGVTEQELAGAYFRGELQPLYDRVASRAVHDPFSRDSPFSLDAYVARLDDKRSFAARRTLMDACGIVEPATETAIETETATEIATEADDTIDEPTTTTIDDTTTIVITPSGKTGSEIS
ncbi:hypothetical protein [Streptosporangium sp. NPDC002721]|uniref:hypothetical protein n=1 Tax=Streptosporangium sp. NPDC002721 TaxID=3366188 RepID=UPI00367AD070